jgi:hypothetical protein
MGKRYEQSFRRLVSELDPPGLLAFIDPGGVDPKYREHIAATLAELGVAMAATAPEANLLVGGYVLRGSDGAVGLAIRSEALGSIVLFPEGYVPADGVRVRAPLAGSTA